ncbi:alpha/beta hydrolase family protein [Herbihabitans rhizosphaerae]|uniref:Alpha/beta hydrolase family protein n=1 Tax=Herbihabitans rhizosphaerae TaxID=1872711 RepID=A0A4Q7L6C8_9PSEU|nr:alpha/beta hydrolase [Herbihabitans rhizosphaerae]RZS44141.1 alpha/beta hydrolase family protein [Herbihabitans rhizosphaerae]
MKRILGALAVLALALTACTGDPETGPAQPPAAEQRGPAGPVPAGLERFYGQPLTWEDCAGYARTSNARQAFAAGGLRCARLTVPLDYANPSGDTITLGLLRRSALDGGRRIGALVTNPGGPGGSGMVSAAMMAEKDKDSELAKRFDLVGFDPRGVGASDPQVRCLTDQERDAERAEDDELDTSPQGVAKQEADSRAFAQRCAERTPKGVAMLANMGSRDVARDMDVLRSTLGEQKLTYLGYSYGTRLGSTYAEAFPGNVRAMVLDGAQDPNQDLVDDLVAQGKGFGQAFDAFVQWCVQRQDCALGKDRRRATSAFHELVRPLAGRPIEVGEGRRLSYSDAMTGVMQALYSQQYWEPLNSGLVELKRNRATTLMLLADSYLERDEGGRYATTHDAFAAIHCVDDPRVTDRAVIMEAQRRYKQAAPFTDDGRGLNPALDPCAFWPAPNTSMPHLPKIAGLPPVLVVSTTGDPATPYDAGVQLARALGGGLLTFEATQHTAFLVQDNKCVDDAGIGYLVDLRLPPPNTRCR